MTFSIALLIGLAPEAQVREEILRVDARTTIVDVTADDSRGWRWRQCKYGIHAQTGEGTHGNPRTDRLQREVK